MDNGNDMDGLRRLERSVGTTWNCISQGWLTASWAARLFLAHRLRCFSLSFTHSRHAYYFRPASLSRSHKMFTKMIIISWWEWRARRYLYILLHLLSHSQLDCHLYLFYLFLFYNLIDIPIAFIFSYLNLTTVIISHHSEGIHIRYMAGAHVVVVTAAVVSLKLL